MILLEKICITYQIKGNTKHSYKIMYNGHLWQLRTFIWCSIITWWLFLDVNTSNIHKNFLALHLTVEHEKDRWYAGSEVLTSKNSHQVMMEHQINVLSCHRCPLYIIL